MNNIYLNNASTVPVRPEVVGVITDVLINNWANPNDVSEKGREARRILERSRETVANFINAEPEEIVFVPSGSAANALAMRCANWNERVLTTTIEHGSIMDNTKCMCNIPVDQYGLVDVFEMEKLIQEYAYMCPMVSVQYASNEIGTIQDIKRIADIVHVQGKILHVDGTQYVPYYKIDVKKENIDMMTFSGHKIGAPSGIAALYVKNGIKLNPLIPGSSQQERGLFAGTENVAYAAGLAKAVELIDYSSTDRIKQKRNYLWEKLSLMLDDQIELNGLGILNKNRICNNLNIRIKGVDNQQLMTMLEMSGIEVSAGSACHSYAKAPSHVLKAIGLSDRECNESIRISLSEFTTFEELDEFVKILKQCIEFLK